MTLLSDLLTQATKSAFYAKGLEVAAAVGLPVTSWQPGDPTRSLYWFVSEILSTLEGVVVNYIASGFLDFAVARAEADPDARKWLVLLAEQVYGYSATEASAGSCTVRLTNNGGGLYSWEPGDLTFQCTATGKTYHNSTGGSLSSWAGGAAPKPTLDLTVVADEAGSASSASVGDIDDLVTNVLGVTVSNTTSLVGLDAESPKSIATGCRAKLGAMSPNGPRDAYVYVAKSSSLTGTTAITRARSIGDSATGEVTLYLAGPSGAVGETDRAKVEAAIAANATPLCITPTVLSATNKTIDVTYALWIYADCGKTVDQVEAAVAAALGSMMTARPIGGDDGGYVYKSHIESVIRGAIADYAFRVSVSLPAADVSCVESDVPVLGAVTPSVSLV